MWRFTTLLTLAALVTAASPVRADDSPASRREAMNLARQLTTIGAATYNSHDAAAMAAFYTPDATVKMVGKDDGGTKVTLYSGRTEIEKLYAGLFKSDQPTHARNTVEYARFVAPDMLLITGTFEPDLGSIKVPFVQMRVHQNGHWLMSELTVFVLPGNG
jgi:ketosteroid isomerase-like protein